MFAKLFPQKAVPQQNIQHGHLTTLDLNVRITLHHGIPSTSSILAFDPIQGLLAVGTLDGRIKVVGGDNIECLLISPIKLPFKSLEFFHNLGHLVSISNDNDIQIWSLEHRCVAFYMQWESNITAFSIIQGSSFIYVGDEFGIVSVLKYDNEEENLFKLPYHIPFASITGVTASITPTVAGILPHPSSPANRVLLAYQNGIIVLWDAREDKYVFLRNSTDIQEKIGDGSNSSDTVKTDVTGPLENGQEDKEICCLCWASNDGSILAVGYIDGDILFWNTISASTRKNGTKVSSADVVKLQLSSAEKRLPVIVLHWRASSNVSHDHGGQLFVYGGDGIGSEEVLTVLNLEWPSGLDSLRCVSRTDLKLHGFADMLFLPVIGSYGKCNGAALFVLTNPGQLHMYDDSSLSVLASTKDGTSICATQFPRMIPLVDPPIVVSKLFSLSKGGKLTDAFAEIILALRTAKASNQKTTTNWPLTGGVPSSLSLDGGLGVERVYIAGYQDGSVRVWDATFPSLVLILEISGEIQGVNVSGTTASVSALVLSCNSGILAIGNEYGLIKIYNLLGSSSGTGCLLISERENEVIVNPGGGLKCAALISVLKSPIRALQFSTSGGQLAVGCEDGQLLMLSMDPIAIMFHRDCLGAVQASIVSMVMKCSRQITTATENLISKSVEEDAVQEMNFLFVADKNAHVFAIDGTTGDMISSRVLKPQNHSCTVSMHVIVTEPPAKKSLLESIQTGNGSSNSAVGTKPCPQNADEEMPSSPKSLTTSFLLLCCEDALRLYSLSSAMEGDTKWIHKVELQKPCCWSAMFRKDEQTMGLVLLYHTGLLEIRSFPDLKLVGETSLPSILRWNLNASMAKIISSDGHGHVALNNNSELAFISILSSENDFRIPDSLPCLHDKVIAAAADAYMSMASIVKKQDPPAGIIGSLMKGLKSGRTVNVDSKGVSRTTFSEDLEVIFSKNPFCEPCKSVLRGQKNVELSIDDIEIDDIVPLPSSSAAPSTSASRERKKRDEETERDKLLGRNEVNMKPRMRTPEEIMAQYGKSVRIQGVAGAAENARNKLAERQEKLERTALRSEELRASAENFKSMADELLKTMERRKWWQI